jgi:hypothetical protein
MSNLTPKQIVDKNGKNTTVHVNESKNSAASAERVSSATATLSPSAVPPSGQYRFESKLPKVTTDTKEVNVRAVADAFQEYADTLRAHAATFDDDEEAEFTEEDDLSSVIRLGEEIATWSQRLTDAEDTYRIWEPESDEVQEYINSVQELANGWKFVADEYGDTARSEERPGGLRENGPASGSFSLWDGKLSDPVYDFYIS